MNPINPNGEARSMKPTKRHRAAIWEAMLGTVYAANAEGVVKYCDYRYKEALEHAGLNTKKRRESADLRVWRNGGGGTKYNRYGEPYSSSVPYTFRTGVQGPEGPGRGQLVLWAVR